MTKPALVLLSAVLSLSTARVVQAGEMVPWRQHQHPFSFMFGNEIDTHQQTRKADDGSLDGYLYVQYTGVVTRDNYRVATHMDCDAAGAECSAGWKVDARPASAQLVRQPVHDHPVFLVGRTEIPQPGSHAHFHWTGGSMPMPYVSVPGYLLELTAVNRFCFIHHGAEAATATASCRDNGGIRVNRGVDIATHLNIVTNDPAGP